MLKKTYIIAEAGVNHNGSLKRAIALVDEAHASGADAVKFQTFQAHKLISPQAKKAEYQIASTGSSESQLEMVKKLELSESDHRTLLAHCKRKGIEFLSTPFDLESVDLLSDMDISRFKIASGEITNAALLLKIASKRKPIILSTGMSTLGDVEQSLGVLAFGLLYADKPQYKPSRAAFEEAFFKEEGQAALKKYVSLLHCTTEYPSPYEDANLHCMQTLRNAFDLPVGLSDHSVGIAIPIAAVGLGACIIEKHFTLDKNLPGPDHKASLDPAELRAMVAGCRAVELALGSSVKLPARSELKNRSIARRSLVAADTIRSGDVFTQSNLTSKRPGDGVSALEYFDYIGTVAERDYMENEGIT